MMEALIFAAVTQGYVLTACRPHEELVELLSEQYDEVVVAEGERADAITMQLWISQDRDSWTVTLHHNGNNQTCIIASGGGFHTVDPKSQPVGSPL